MEAKDPRGVPYYWMTGSFVNDDADNEDTDIWALEHNYISVVPSMHDLTNYHAVEEMKPLEQIGQKV
jgi:5'-nucleotidase